ncbi:EamA family transporter [Actinokineospora fastidiosa]|uniref:ABC transporter permease n=1 Tax=Actinokineospora fastidiosa TaxID=1816 RepID=A0A918G557_9PSEU|nr:EamA family transporter [Actinokineospora fastidiosa]GGS17717.1 ABC transporter permease [Actinokineospora fastidiosa]
MVLRTAIAPVLWGSTYLVTTEFLPPSPMWIAVLRALPAGLLLLAIRPGMPSGPWLGRLFALGGLNIGVFFALLFVSATRLPGGVAATLGAAQVVVVLGLAALWLKEPVTLRKAAVAVAGIAGVSLLVLRGSQALDPIGVLAGLGTAVSLGAGLVLTRKWGAPPGMTALTATGWQLLGGSILLVPLAIATEGAPPSLDWVAVGGFVWLTLISTALAYVLFFSGLRRLSAGQVSLLGLASPLTATVLGWAVLDQTLTGWQLAGAALVLGAVVVGQRPSRPNARSSDSDSSGEVHRFRTPERVV